MSITRTERLDCPCGTPVTISVADSLNGARYPEIKQTILDRTLHVFRCDACKRLIVVEKDLLYFDFEKKQFFCMYPRIERAREAECSAQVQRAYEAWLGDQAPKFVADVGREFLVRVCFGYEELREKIVIDDAGLSDLVLEAVKIDVMTAEPWFEQTGVATLRLDAVEPDGVLRLVPEYLDAPPPGEARVVRVQRALYDAVVEHVDEILVRHPGLAKGVHVSLLRLIDWPAA